MKKCAIETTDLNALLDSLTDGEHVKATWTQGKYLTTVEGPVRISGLHCSSTMTIRFGDGTIDHTLTSFEVARTEEVTATCDDVAALHALLDSLEEGQEVTAEWRAENRSMTLTGTALSNGSYRAWVRGLVSFPLRWINNQLNRDLHSVTTHRTVARRWEREKKEHPRGAMSAGTHMSGHTLDLRAEAVAHGQPNHDWTACPRCLLSNLLWGGEKPLRSTAGAERATVPTEALQWQADQ